MTEGSNSVNLITGPGLKPWLLIINRIGTGFFFISYVVVFDRVDGVFEDGEEQFEAEAEGVVGAETVDEIERGDVCGCGVR